MDEAKDDKMTLWIVIAHPGEGKDGLQSAKAFFNEDNARFAAGQMVGVDDRWINIKSIEIEDRLR